jgi:protease I
MERNLEGISVAILASHGFEQAELEGPRRAIEDHGGVPVIVAPHAGPIRGWDRDRWGEPIEVDRALDSVAPSEFEALVIPGGLMSPDRLRTDPAVGVFVRSFCAAGKPVAAICHAPWILIDAGVVRGRTVTSYPSLRTDLLNAGAQWVDEAVVVDGELITSRRPEDLPAFIAALFEMLIRRHARRRAG